MICCCMHELPILPAGGKCRVTRVAPDDERLPLHYQLFTRFIFIHEPTSQLCLIRNNKRNFSRQSHFPLSRAGEDLSSSPSANEKCKKIPFPQKPKHTRPKGPDHESLLPLPPPSFANYLNFSYHSSRTRQKKKARR